MYIVLYSMSIYIYTLIYCIETCFFWSSMHISRISRQWLI